MMVLTVCVIASTSCEEDNNTENSWIEIYPEQSDVRFKANGKASGNATFEVYGSEKWKVESDQPWVTVTTSEDGFTLSAAATTTVPVLAKVTVSAGKATPIVLNVTQSADSYDVYVAGYNSGYPGKQTAIVWKNGVATKLTSASTGEHFNDCLVFVLVNNIFCASGKKYDSGGISVWENGELTDVIKPNGRANCNSLFVVKR
ncbi:hypothetical protein FACS189440_20180 [Bacteroidia bacterium]|nr:hypothetical protein FACS189440_20180 [Bacteroidia bacterium]